MLYLAGEMTVLLIIAAAVGLLVGLLLGWVGFARRKTAASAEAERQQIEIDQLYDALSDRDAKIKELAATPPTPRRDDLKLINGIGPVFERTLNAMGYSTFEQIAAWTTSDIRDVAAETDLFPDRIVSDRWVEQAKTLATEKAAQRVAAASAEPRAAMPSSSDPHGTPPDATEPDTTASDETEADGTAGEDDLLP